MTSGAPRSLATHWMTTVLDELPSALMMVNAAGDLLHMNQKAYALLGTEAMQPFERLEAFPPYLQPLATLIATTQETIARSQIELLLPPSPVEMSLVENPSSEPSVVELASPRPVTFGFSLTIRHLPEMGQVKFFIFSDITQVLLDRQQAERIKDELFQSKKLAAMGAMITGVAHELNNPVIGISMSVELAKMKLAKTHKHIAEQIGLDDPFCRNLEEMFSVIGQEMNRATDATRRATVLVRDLMDYAKPARMTLEPVDWGEFLQKFVADIAQQPVFANAQFSWLPLECPLLVKVDRVRMEQVFYNLFKNATEASEGQPHIEIGFQLSGPVADKRTKEPVYFVHCLVRDEGQGMPPDVLEQIFEPFFTTKGRGGVGLGLSISYKTMEMHGGALSVESQPGQGTTFTVTLPLASDSVPRRIG
ncbi:MAG: ATP-binding protein [Candidatus Melainabacteria bacterium]|nr:ATP-binding protein [Candidatus Melainabacteria bacterium]